MITSPSGKSYIGQTCDYEKRMREHKRNGSSCIAIRDAGKKYGWENMITKVLLKNLTLSEANKYEEFYIKEHSSMFPNGYNLREGGLNKGLSDEVKRKIGNGNRGKKHSPEQIENHRNLLKGRTNSDEVRLKISLGLKGKPKSEAHKQKTREAHIGMKASDTAKLNMSLAQLGRIQSESSIKKQMESFRESRNSIEYPFYELNIVGLPDDTVFNTKELASLLNISRPCTITRRIRNGNFPNTVTSSKKGGKVYYIPIQDVHDYYNR